MNYQLFLDKLHLWMIDAANWFSASTSAKRRRNQEAVGHPKAERNKREKKFRKWGKKSKEKSEEERVHDAENKNISDEAEGKCDTDINASSQIDMKGSLLKKRLRQRKQITLEKEDDHSHPISSSTDDTDELSSLSNSPILKQPMEEEPKCLMADKSTGVKDDFKQVNFETPIVLQPSFRDKVEITESLKPVRKSPTKKSRKPKSDHLDFGSESRILSAIKSSSLTEDEVQHILDVLGTKQKINEKKKNEISTLKKTIQEREDALRMEQKISQSANERISELLQELCEQKSHATATEKSLRDALNQEQQEIKALHGMMQRKREQYGAEISSLQSKMQQMKNKMKEEHTLSIQRLQDESNQLQTLSRIETEKTQRSSLEISRLQHEVDTLRASREKFETHQAAMQQSQEDLHLQIQQLEKHIEQLLNSHQEEEYSYKQRLNEMSNKIQQTENARASLVQELQNAQSVCSSLESDNSSLRQRLDESKHQSKTSEQELLQLQSRLEESSRQQRDLANCLEKMRSEVMDLSNFKHEHLQIIQTLKKENEALATKVNQSMSESTDRQSNGNVCNETTHIDIGEHEVIVKEKEIMLQCLKLDLEQCKSKIITITSELEAQNKLSKELEEKTCELTSLLKASEKKVQEVQKTAEKKVQEAQKQADNSSKEMQNLLNQQIKEVEVALRETYSKELETTQQDAELAKKDAEEKLLKSETEANVRLEEFQESLYKRLDEFNAEADVKFKDAVKEKELLQTELTDFCTSIKDFLQRVFPSIDAPESINDKALFTEYETEIESFLEELKGDNSHDSKDIDNLTKKLEVTTQEKRNFESQICIYESVLAETENVLKNLQNNIENEEKRWKLELQCKDESLAEVLKEIEELKSENISLKAKLEQLQGLQDALYEIEELRIRLQKEESEKKLLLEKINSIQESPKESSTVATSDDNSLQFSEVNPNVLPSKSEKKKKSRKRGASGKK